MYTVSDENKHICCPVLFSIFPSSPYDTEFDSLSSLSFRFPSNLCSANLQRTVSDGNCYIDILEGSGKNSLPSLAAVMDWTRGQRTRP